jgi:hypothetical protein
MIIFGLDIEKKVYNLGYRLDCMLVTININIRQTPLATKDATSFTMLAKIHIWMHQKIKKT